MNKFDKTFINPISLIDYPFGLRLDRGAVDRDHRIEYREFADVSALWDDNKWYLYGSAGMVFWSEDYKTWHHAPTTLGDDEIGAPTIVKHNNKYYALANGSKVYEALSPLGPFNSIGYLKYIDGKEFTVADPMYFSDDDGRLYLYYGCGSGIRVAEIDANNPTQLITEPLLLFKDEAVDHEWERMGANNENATYSWVEGAWMFKRNDTYYLTYCAPNTEYPTYAMGAYKGTSPMGPYEYMQTSPFLTNRYSTFKGSGHGSVAVGPNNTVWAFYTGCIGYANFVERFIGMQPIGFDQNGDIIPTVVDSTPQWLPGVKENPHIDNNAGLVSFTAFKMRYEASSEAPGRDGIYALDENALSWWQPLADDKAPTLTVPTVDYGGESNNKIYAARIAWRYIGMDIMGGKFPGPVKYKIEALTPEGEWVCVLDKTDNDIDLYFDYQTLDATYANAVRLTITERPKDLEVGVMDFTVYGKWEPNK